MKFDKVKDSGAREDMETGSRRDTQVGKSRPDLMNPLVLRRLGMHFANGCDKYGEKNFELGQKSSRYRASLGRHLLDYDEGLKDEDHLAAIIWNAMCIMMNQEFVERGIYDPNLDDHSDYTSKEGFDTTVGKRARAFNDALRRAGKFEEEQRFQPMPSDTCTDCIPQCDYSNTGCGDCRIDEKDKICCQPPHTIEQVPDEQCDGTAYLGEDLIEVPELPVCFGYCEKKYCRENICLDWAECSLLLCCECDFDVECIRDSVAHTPTPNSANGCKDCMSWDKDYTTWPCCECTRNHDIMGDDKTNDFYHTLDDLLG